MAALAGFTACTGDQAQPPVNVPEGGVGNGTWNDPLTTYQASLGSIANDTVIDEEGTLLVKEREQSWVKGYIVGYIDVNITNVMKEETCVFGSGNVATNIVMAMTPDETDWTKCIPVQLPSGAMRNVLNVMDHPENVGALVTIYGTTGSKYCSAYGVRSVTNYKWGDKGVFTPKTIFNAPFTNGNWANFTVDNGGQDGMWTLDNRYGVVAKGRFDNVNYDCKGSIISPEIYLGRAEKPAMMFSWAANYFSNVDNLKRLVKICVRKPGGEWTDAEIPVWPNGKSWDFVSSGLVDLSAFKGGRVQIGIFYESTTSVSGTLELRDLQVLDATQFDNAPVE